MRTSTGFSQHNVAICATLCCRNEESRETATRLFQAAANGTLIPLGVIVADGPMVALDDVLVSGVTSSGGTVDAYMTRTLDAGAVRFL